MQFSERLCECRQKSKMTQEELAEKCDVSRQAIAKWEKGESVPTLDKLIVLADIFNLTLDEMVGRKSIDEFERVVNFLKNYTADDIPRNEDDEISTIMGRYFKFADSIKLSTRDKWNGMNSIFLNNAIGEYRGD